ncbi:hypothetical protein PV10_02226 [Exophiala mesophila]|uniref:Uncharacterized protein n=1 Tax=Exophiala mesophila TaxID=212818 RepID=A0A0D1WYC8_EXOME|nr:uncharacterized protein PV10_02226 [Exophiala mesophila]KIV94460.1 hypothetical protein PV10_02226 [Exophiala mesophila]
MIHSQQTGLPVTALKPVEIGSEFLLVAGSGPWLHVYDQNSGQVLRQQVFPCQPIHGIDAIEVTTPAGDSKHISILIWGGRWLRYGELSVLPEHQSLPNHVILELSDLFDAKDWVLKAVSVTTTSLHTAPHNSSTFFLLTAHNALLRLKINSHSGRQATQFELLDTVPGPATFLYSGDIKATHSGGIIVASGTVFGEIFVWTCHNSNDESGWVTTLRHTFTGHEGSIFGVTISQEIHINGVKVRLLASCSDDRTIQIWNISDSNVPAINSIPSLGPRETGFGVTRDSEISQLTKTWAHSSRIWNVEFAVRQVGAGDHRILVLSEGEDATCQLWELVSGTGQESIMQQQWTISPHARDHHHLGKNAWSMSHLLIYPSLVVYSGGADNQVVQRRFDVDQGLTKSSTISHPFRGLSHNGKVLKQYTMIDHDICLANTDDGDLYQLSPNGDTLVCTKTLSNPLKGSVVICYVSSHGMLLMAPQAGGLSALVQSTGEVISLLSPLEASITWMSVALTPAPGMPCIVARLSDSRVVALWVSDRGPAVQVTMTNLGSPDTFNVTASCYDPCSRCLVLGSRAGALAFYADVDAETAEAQNPFVVRHVHGTDSVTSLRLLDPSPHLGPEESDVIHILSTGKDGTFSVHRVVKQKQTFPPISTIHRSSPPFGPNIEGSYLVPRTIAPGNQVVDLVLCGFKSTSFIVWNETQRTTLLDIECGGSHRTWSYKPLIELAANKISPSPPVQVERQNFQSFVWTKAGKINWHIDKSPPSVAIGHSSHGREIKAMAKSSRPYTDKPRGLENCALLATGAEDTDIQLFAIEPTVIPDSHKSGWHNLVVLKGHTTGLQHLQFSPASRFLFSSAGFEEFFVWKLTYNVPCVGVGVVLQDRMPKVTEDSDARIMGFDLQEKGQNRGVLGEEESSFVLAMAYSNGKVKVINYQPTANHGTGAFEVIHIINFGSFCLLQTSILPNQGLSDHTSSVMQILSAGTNGALNLTRLASKDKADDAAPDGMELKGIHQSSILAMDVIMLWPRMYLTTTGGDDNALGLTFLNVDTEKEFTSPDHPRTIIIPKAHAAAITALKVVECITRGSTMSVTIATVGNDQRAKAWRVEIPVNSAAQDQTILLQDVRVRKLASAWTAVADVSSLELVSMVELRKIGEESEGGLPERDFQLMIAGVGTELIKIQLP